MTHTKQQVFQTLTSYNLSNGVNMDQNGGHEFKLACQYEFQQCYPRAQFWYQTASHKGHHQAQNNLAVMYALGQVDGTAPIDALNWFLKSAEQGDVLANKNLKSWVMDEQSIRKQRFVI